MSPAETHTRQTVPSSGGRPAHHATNTPSRRYPTAQPAIKSRSGSNTTITGNNLKPTSTRPHRTTITVVEPTRDQYQKTGATTIKKESSMAGKVLKGAGDAVGCCFYILFFCCVLSGEKRPQPRRHDGAYYNFDDELEGPRVRKVDSSGSKASSEKIERA